MLSFLLTLLEFTIYNTMDTLCTCKNVMYISADKICLKCLFYQLPVLYYLKDNFKK